MTQEQERMSADEARKILKLFRFWEKFTSDDFTSKLRLGIGGWLLITSLTLIFLNKDVVAVREALIPNLLALFGIVIVILLALFIGKRRYERLQQYYERVLYSVTVSGVDHIYFLALKFRDEDDVLYIFRTNLWTTNDRLEHLYFSYVFDLEHEVSVAVFRYSGSIRFTFMVQDYSELSKQLIYDGNADNSFDVEMKFSLRNKLSRVFPRVQFESFSGMKTYFEHRCKFFSKVFDSQYMKIASVELDMKRVPISRLKFKLKV